MKYSRNSLLLTAGLFAMAAAIVFHAWWPSYKADRDLERYVAECLEDTEKVRNLCIKEYYLVHSARTR